MLEKQFDVILTGATGIVGSHVLYELIEQKLAGKLMGRILLLVRSSKMFSVNQRVKKILSHQCLPDFLSGNKLEALLNCVEIMEGDFSKPDFSFSKEIDLKNTHLIHSAASTNLASDQSAYDENYNINYLGTLKLYNETKSFVKKFIYISTAFACGIRTGVVNDDYHSLTELNFRNPYEEIKLKTEKKLIQECKKDSIKFQVIRPGVVVGRLINKPLYFLPRYNVIYAFAAFFDNLLRRKTNSPININVHRNAQLHLVSVDYVAKSIARLFTKNDVEQINIIPKNGCGIEEISSLMDVVGYDNYKFVNSQTEARDKIEAIYKNKVATSFEPYISNEYYEFDNSKLLKIMGQIKMPDVKLNFKQLIGYAKANFFEFHISR